MSRINTQPIGDHVRTRREALGLSARKLARIAGIDNGTLLRIEHGDIRQPRPATLDAIETALAHWTDTDRELPPLTTYLRARYPSMPERAVSALNDYFDY